MKTSLALVLLFPALAWGQTFTEYMQAAGAAVDARVAAAERKADEVMAALQVETADISAINVSTQRLADEMSLLRAEVAALRTRLDAMPALKAQQITVMTP